MKTGLIPFGVGMSLALICMIGRAYAADAPLPGAADPATPENALEQVTVNARRTEENLQSVPVAITAVSEATLLKQDIRTFQDMEMITPGLDVCCARGSTGLIWMRGVPGVVGYFSEVPADLNGQGLFFDVSNMQVLKGPQGTLFGIATNGGAILAQPARPTDEFTGWGAVSIGDYNRVTTEGVLNVPLVSDKVLVRVGGERVRTDGYIRDLTTGQDLGGDDYWVARIGVMLIPNEYLNNYFVLNYSSDNSLPAPGVIQFGDPNPALYANAVFGSAAVAADVAQQRRLGDYHGYSALTDQNAYNRHLNLVDIAELKLSDDIKLRNLAGYQSIRSFSRVVGTLGELPYTVGATPDSGASGPVETWTEELQLQGSVFGDRLNFTVGSFNSGNNQQDVKPVYTINFGLPESGLAAKNSGSTYAVYAQGTYDLSDVIRNLSVTGGYRYTWDNRRLRQQQYDSTQTAVSEVNLAAAFHAPSYTAGLQYQLNPQVMLFITNSKGSSSGGFNPIAPPGESEYNPEFLNNIEYGTKAQFQIGQLEARTNISGYYGFYHDVQVSILKVVQTPSGPTYAVVVDNAAKAAIKGVESDISLRWSSWLEINSGFQYGNTGYLTYNNVSVTGQIQDYRDAPFVGFSKRKFNVGAVIHLPVPASLGQLSVSADYAWKSRLFAGIATDMPDPRSWRPPMGYLNLGAQWNDILQNKHLQATLAVTNVNNEALGAGHSQLVDIGGVQAYEIHTPRMYSLRLQYSF